MKIKNIYILFFASALVSLTSCNDFLDTMPDQRAEVNSTQKVRDILVSAYPFLLPTAVGEMMSDNVMDNGAMYSQMYNIQIEAYHWKDVTETVWDAPEQVWASAYSAIASANQALEAIEEMGNTEEMQSAKGEALICRAYSHFILATTFCMAYNPQTCEQEMGIPYAMSSENEVNPHYERGTLKATYEKINADIEAGLPLVNDSYYSVPLYHFNRKAAYAFAARFNLFYGQDYQKVVDYCDEAIGSGDPAGSLRNIRRYVQTVNNPTEMANVYIGNDEPANLLCIPFRYTEWGRSLPLRPEFIRYGHSRSICESQTLWAPLPFGTNLPVYASVYGSDNQVYFPKLWEMFEFYDQSAGTGQPHIVIVQFSTDETLLCRAEAYVMLKDYDNAAKDLSFYYVANEGKACTAKQIQNFYAAGDVNTICKPLNPQAHALDTPEQVNMIQAVLHARRIQGIHEGTRWFDIKRFGIEITHNVSNGQPITLKVNDPRRAIQIPSAVISAGLPKNPR